MNSIPMTAIVARDFRGTTLFLTSHATTHSVFIWSKDRSKAQTFMPALALEIAAKAMLDWQANAYAIDSAGEILKPAGSREPVSQAETQRQTAIVATRNVPNAREREKILKNADASVPVTRLVKS